MKPTARPGLLLAVAMCMDIITWLAGVIAVAFVGAVIVLAAFRLLKRATARGER
jgi:uncharacterized membrane protein YeaQ/YmgE (transglycosylase-associated protein family)